MAGAKELRSKLNDEFLTCQICLNIYSDPVALDCQHSFCRDCVGQCLAKVSGSLHCPMCRQKTNLPKKTGTLSLKKNFFLQSLIDALNERRSSRISTFSFDDVTVIDRNGNESKSHTKKKNGKLTCDNCQGEKSHAVARCLDCTDYLCRDCDLVHCQTKFTRKHKVVPLKELRSGNYASEIQMRAKIFCPAHPEEVCRLLCEDCSLPVCHECLENQHKDHTRVDIKDAVSREKERVLRLLASTEDREDELSAKLLEVQQSRERTRREKKNALDEIQKRTKAIMAAAKAHEDKLTKLVKAITKSRKQRLSTTEEAGQEKLTLLQTRRSELKHKSDVLTTGTPLEILALKPVCDDVEDVSSDLTENWMNATQALHSDWSIVPCVNAERSSSFVLDRIKPVLKNLIGSVQCDANDLPPGMLDDDVLTSTSSGGSATSDGKSSGDSESQDQTYCYMRSLLPTMTDSRPTSSGNALDLTSDDEENENKPAYYKMQPVRRKGMKKAKPSRPPAPPAAESPSLNLMRKFPPKIQECTSGRKNGVSEQSDTERPAATTSKARSTSKSDAASKNKIVVRWRDNRSRSADRVLDEPSTSTHRPRPISDNPTSLLMTSPPTNPSPNVRGRNRRRSLPGSAGISTLRALSSPSGSCNSLLHLATSPVAALAENPARLGIYQPPDPTSDAAVASLSHTIATAPTMNEINDMGNGDSPHDSTGRSPKSFEGLYPMGSDDNVFVKSFQNAGKVTSFRSAPKLSVTPGGHVIATDYKAQRVFTFGETGAVLSSIKTKAFGQKCLHPISASATKKGKLLVACGDALYKFTTSGKLTKKLGAGCFRKCCGVAHDFRSDKIVVTDIDKKCVSIHSADGGLERIFRGDSLESGHQEVGGSNPSAEMRLQTPYFVAVNPTNSNIIVSDWATNDVKVFDVDGSCLACISSCSTSHPNSPFSPPPADSFSNPAGVCCDVSGNLFIADHGRHRVAMFNSNWQFQKFIATASDGLQNPWSLATSSDGSLYVSEYWSRTIKKFQY